MKVTTYDEVEPELLGVGQTTNKSASLQKEASLETNGLTKKLGKKIAKENRKQKNLHKGKVERSKTSKRDEKFVSKRLRGRKAKEELFNSQLKTFALEDEPEKNQMTAIQKEQIHKELEERGFLDTKLCPDKDSVTEKHAKEIDKIAMDRFCK